MQDQRARRALESSLVRFLIAAAITIPVVFGGIQSERILREYRESSSYTVMANWYARQADEARSKAEMFLRRAYGNRGGIEGVRWDSQAAEQLALAEQSEARAQLCRRRAREWGVTWLGR